MSLEADYQERVEDTAGVPLAVISGVSDRAFLGKRAKAAYAIGHVLNDLCASMWFTYLLLYFNYVKEFGPTLAGQLLLVGQIADGLVTPFVGLESDRHDALAFCAYYGRRKTWHLIGTIAVVCSFPFIFMECAWCQGADHWAEFYYYSVFIVIFQFGWASTQVSHLSLIPDLTPHSHERISLNAYRYAFTVASNIFVYAITWAVLHIGGDAASAPVGRSDARSFQTIVLSVVSVGAVFSLLFHLCVPDPTQNPAALHQQDGDADISSVMSNTRRESGETSNLGLTHLANRSRALIVDRTLHLSWRDWLKESQFYIIGLLYMATRLYVNLSQVFIGLYIQQTLELPKQSVAIVPLVMYISGFLASFPVNRLATFLKLKTIYSMGITLAIVGALWILLGDRTTTFRHYEIYGVAAVIGIASTILLITSLSITNELIGCSTSSGAFVFGAMSFLDKLSNGIVVIIIESLHTCNIWLRVDKKYYYHYVMVYACGGASVTGIVALLILAKSKESNKRKDLLDRISARSHLDSQDLRNSSGGPSERTSLLET